MIVRGNFSKLLGYNKDICSPKHHWFASHWPFRLFVKHKTKFVDLQEFFRNEYE
jgi:hypothetical protein